MRRSYPRSSSLPRNCAKRPSCAYDGEPIPPKFKWHQVRDDDLRENDDPTPTNTLNGPADQHVGEVLRQCSNERPHQEEDEGDQHHCFSAKDVRKRGVVGLQDSGGEKECSAGPEGFDGGAVEFRGNGLEFISSTSLGSRVVRTDC